MSWLSIVLGLLIGVGSFVGFNYWYNKTRSPLAWRLWCCAYIAVGSWMILYTVGSTLTEGFKWLNLVWFISAVGVTFIGLYGWQGRKYMDETRDYDRRDD